MLMVRPDLLRRIRLLHLTLPLALAACFCCYADAPKLPSQLEVEQVYLFDFGKFVQWPADADTGTLNICLAASPTFSAGMEKIVADETIAGRPLAVRRLAAPGDEDGCAMLFIEAAEQRRTQQLLDSLEGKPALTVSDSPDFLARGGMIQFQLVDKRVRFSVNLEAVRRAHLTMSSELLKVALEVKGRPEGSAQ